MTVLTGLLPACWISPRPKTPEIEDVDVSEIIRHTMELVGDDARHRGIDIQAGWDVGVWNLKADRDQLIQALLNLLLNAIEAMPDGGRINLDIARGDHEIGILVEDNGPGIPEGDMDKLSDPFFTTKKKGTGLGLAQVAGILKSHGGRLEITNTEAGAKVSMYFKTDAVDQIGQ